MNLRERYFLVFSRYIYPYTKTAIKYKACFAFKTDATTLCLQLIGRIIETCIA